MRLGFFICGGPLPGFDPTNPAKKYLGQFFPRQTFDLSVTPNPYTITRPERWISLVPQEAFKMYYLVKSWKITGNMTWRVTNFYGTADVQAVIDGSSPPYETQLAPDGGDHFQPRSTEQDMVPLIGSIFAFQIMDHSGNGDVTNVTPFPPPNPEDPAEPFVTAFDFVFIAPDESNICVSVGSSTAFLFFARFLIVLSPPSLDHVIIISNYAGPDGDYVNVGSVSILGASVPMYIQSTADRLGGTSVDLTLTPASYWEYRDSTGANPIFDSNTGAQLITPMPANL